MGYAMLAIGFFKKNILILYWFVIIIYSFFNHIDFILGLSGDLHVKHGFSSVNLVLVKPTTHGLVRPKHWGIRHMVAFEEAFWEG